METDNSTESKPLNPLAPTFTPSSASSSSVFGSAPVISDESRTDLTTTKLGEDGKSSPRSGGRRASRRGGKRASKRGGSRASKRGGKRASKRGGKRSSRRGGSRASRR